MTVSRLRPYAVTIFAEMSALAARIGAVNLGQGFPDEDCGSPEIVEGFLCRFRLGLGFPDLVVDGR